MARIVVIDDDLDLCGYVTHHLELDGHTALFARDGFEGIELIEEHRPDLIILDVMMPGLDGVQICKRLKNHHEISRIPVIFLSAKSGAASRLRGINSGGQAYVTKPFNMSDLTAKIDTVLAHSQPGTSPSPTPSRPQ